MHLKHFTASGLKALGEGRVTAKIATLGVVDKDGDVLADGCLAETKVAISPFGHAIWTGQPGIVPLGYGIFKQDGDFLIFDGQYNMDVQSAREQFADLKMAEAMGVNTEWSFSLRDIVGEQVKVGNQTARLIKSFTAHEVSRVPIGASIGSETLALKAAGTTKQLTSTVRRLLQQEGTRRWPARWPYVEDFDLDEGFAVFELIDPDGGYELVQVPFTRTATSVTLGEEETPVIETEVFLPKGDKFSEHIKAVVAAVDALTARASEVVALRAEKGKSLSDESTELLRQLTDRLDAVKAVTDRTPTPDQDALANELARFIYLSTGVTP